MENNNKSVFETLSAVNVSDKIEKKGNLSYLSWSYAWGEVKKRYPSAQYKVYERDTQQYGPINYFTDGMTCYVKVSVTIEGLEHVEMLPVMDYKNQAVPLAKVNSCLVNKSIQRAVTKACARHGLGLYVYAKEDLPECESQPQYSTLIQPAQPATKSEKATQPQAPALQQAPVKDTRPVTAQIVDFLKKTLEEHQVTPEFIFNKYKVSKLEDLQVYQAKHIGKNIDKLKQMLDNEKRENLTAIVKNSKPKDIVTTFGDVICPPQQPQQEKAEGEEVSLESLGLSPADLDALTECGNVFN